MRKLLPSILLLLPVFAIAQKNAVKVNLSSLLLKNYHIQYERKIVSKLTVNLGFRYMPKSGLPLEETLKKYGGLDDPNLKIGEFQMGNTAFTIEPRLYLSKKAMKGFYIAPYARWASFDLGLPFSYTYTDPNPAVGTQTKTAVFNGKIKSFSGGLMFGTQFSLAKHLVLDIWWIGGHYGSSKGDLNFTASLPTAQERQAVDNAVANFDPSPFKITTTPATPNGKQMQSDGPWAGIRALGINLGFKF